jgi:Ca2+-binding EF-hand superfamily protein
MRRTLLTLGLLAATLAATVTTASAQPPGPGKIRDHRKGAAGGKPTAAAEALFDKADANHDGKITKEEFRRVAASVPVLKIKPGDADKLFARLDSNRDGFLTKAEIKQLPARLKGLVSKEGAKGLFDKLKGAVVGKIADKLKAADKDKDGKLSKDEFRSLVVGLKLPKVNAAVADKLFAKLDRNKDGKLSQDEAKQIEAQLKGLVPSLTKAGLEKAAKGLLGKVKDAALGKVKDAVIGKLKSIF